MGKAMVLAVAVLTTVVLVPVGGPRAEAAGPEAVGAFRPEFREDGFTGVTRWVPVAQSEGSDDDDAQDTRIAVAAVVGVLVVGAGIRLWLKRR